MAGFGTPISSIPNTSWANVTAPVSYVGSSATTPTLTKPGMDPFSIGLGVAGIGSSIFGAFSQRDAAREQARATEAAAREQRAAVEEAARIGARGQIAQAGLNYLGSRYEIGPGNAGTRMNEARALAQRANIEANNPSVVALRRVQEYDERLRGAMPGIGTGRGVETRGFVPPSALFV
jgi:hypothetical protein